MLNDCVDSNILNTQSYSNSANFTLTQTSIMCSILNQNQAGRLPERDTGYVLASKACSACFTGKPHLEGWVSRRSYIRSLSNSSRKYRVHSFALSKSTNS